MIMRAKWYSGTLGALSLLTFVLQVRKNPEKTSPRKLVPTEDRTRARCVTGAHAAAWPAAVDASVDGKLFTVRVLSHTPALLVLAPAPDAMLSNGLFHTQSGPAEMPAPAQTFGNAAGDDLDMPEVGTTAGLSVTMFLIEPFHTQVKSCRWRSPVCYFDCPYLIWISLSRFSKRRVSFESWLFFVVRMCTLFKYDVVTLIELVESRPCLWVKIAVCFKDKIEKQRLGEKFM